MTDYTIAESYTLPSLGKVYSETINPHVKIRSMTVEEEMKRLAPSDRPYKMLSEIIDDCLIEKPGISAYDLCVGDYQFLLHKLRVVTYGPDYKIITTCPYCGNKETSVINLEDLSVKAYSEDIEKYKEFVLPRSNKKIRIRMQTPRLLDDVTVKVQDFKKKATSFVGDPAFLFTLESLIESIDDKPVNPLNIQEFIRKLPMMDTNFIIKNAQKLDEGVGLNTAIELKCSDCGLEYPATFRTTAEFFGPSID